MKKKGLIISTVVMVVVLIASLTTATYAWFSVQASATVDDLAITTEAAQGLQIAMVNNEYAVTDLQSGELTYADDTWEGEAQSWGTYLGFAGVQIGQMENAVTKFAKDTAVAEVKKLPAPVVGYTASSESANGVVANLDPSATYFVATAKTVVASNPTSDQVVFKYGEHYALKTGVFTLATKDDAAVGNTVYVITLPTDQPTATSTPGDNNYYCVEKTESWDNALNGYLTDDNAKLSKDLYLVPTGYDNNIEPTGYKIATANAHYYKLTMAVNTTKVTKSVGFSLAINPTNAGNTGDSNYPGMAAASRIQVLTKKNENNAQVKDTTLEPFGKYKLSETNLTFSESTADADANKNKDGKYAFYLEKASGEGSSIAQGSVYFVTMLIWVEGTDNECNNATAGTGFEVKINFVYSENDTAPDWKLGTWNGTADESTLIAG